MIDYRYVLVRFVPDPERMEPTNVGVILQGNGDVDIQFSPHAAKRKEIDTEIYNEWKAFFQTEIRGDAAPLFQPDRATPKFLQHLEALCGETVMLSRPLLLSVDDSQRFEDVLQSLYRRLVAPREVEPAGAATRPTGRFRQLAEEYRFDNRGMKKHAHVHVNDNPLWMAYRQVVNGETIALDKVEVRNQIGMTSLEIQILPLIADNLPKFASEERKHYLLVDELEQPFTDQTVAEFEAMRDDLERCVGLVERAGGTVIREVTDVETLANRLDSSLPPSAVSG